MGRGRAKAKQTKVARELKYGGPHTDFDQLQAELSGQPAPVPVEKVTEEEIGTQIKVLIVNGAPDSSNKQKTDKVVKSQPNSNDQNIFNKIVEVFDGEILR